MCLTGIVISLSLSVCVAKRRASVYVCVWNVWRPLSHRGVVVCPGLRRSHTHTHPKASGEEGEVIKPLIAPFWSSCYCLSMGGGSVCVGREGEWGGSYSWQVQLKPSLDTNTSHTNKYNSPNQIWSGKDHHVHKFPMSWNHHNHHSRFDSL